MVAIAAGNRLPLAVSVESASPAECRLVVEVLARSFLGELPAQLIGDIAYDSDRLDEKLATKYGIELISPNRRGRKRIDQDGRQPRRYRRRWKVERPFAWIHNFRRLVNRWNATSKTSSVSSISPAFTCSSDVYKTASSA
ncbi:MAG: transposase [Acidobacteriaceae bacterium]